MMESVMCDCIPVVPFRLSYNELYNPSILFRYEDFDTLVYQVYNLTLNWDERYQSGHFHNLKTNLINKGAAAIENMVKIMRGE